jgi:hypothetical protein
MSSLEATATAVTTRTGPWFKRRYEVRLFINNVNTGLHWHVKRREVNKISADIVDNAAELLQSFGLMDDVYDAVAGKTDLNAPVERPVPLEPAATAAVGVLDKPRLGQRMEVTADLGTLKAGTVGTIVRIDDEDFYPIRMAFKLGADTVELPMNLSELKAVA